MRLALEGSVANSPPSVPPVRFHSSQLSTVPKARSGESGGRARSPVAQEVGDLRGGEVRVEHQPRPLPHHGEVAVALERGADVGRAPVLPDDGPVQRPPAGAVEGDQRLALIGDADGRHGAPRLGEAAPDLGQRGAHGLPDLGGVVLDPPRAGEVLGDLPVGHVGHPGPLVDDQCPHPGRPGIDGHHMAHGGRLAMPLIRRPEVPSRARMAPGPAAPGMAVSGAGDGVGAQTIASTP